MMIQTKRFLPAIAWMAVIAFPGPVQADQWARFRGPSGSGAVSQVDSIPTRWSPDANIAWKTPLPGPGVSSPIVVDGKVFVTCYSGYGLDRENPGQIEDLMRHLVCIDLQTGDIVWQKDVKAAMPEDPYTGIGVTAHGYASHTPVTDGKHVYAFFGKSGVYAFDFSGQQIWQTDVGKESDPTNWGSSSSPVLYQDIVIVTAAAESQSIVGLDKQTGKELWRQEAEGLDGMWGTPTLVEIDEDRTDLVMCVAKEMWGLDPSSGKLRWFAEATGAEQAYSSVVTDGNKVFAFTGRGGGSIGLKAGGKGDISQTGTLWTGTETASFSSPVRHQSKLYTISSNVVTIVDADSGDKLDQVRLQGAERTGGRFGSLDYPSPIVVGDRLFYLNGSGQMFVFDLNDGAKQIAVNKVSNDKESFGGSPAVSDGRLLLRSERALYCVTDKGEEVSSPEANEAFAATDQPADDQPGESGRGGNQGGGQRGARTDSGGGGNERFDPMSIFTARDANNDGRLSREEIDGGPMADRMKDLDKDGDGAVSQEEFRTGMSAMFSGTRPGGGGGDEGRGGEGRGNRGRGEGGRGEGGRGDGGRGQDSRPDRPQRPELAD